MCPSSRFPLTRTAFARPGRCHPSPASSPLCGPPTSSPPSASAPVPLAFGLPRHGRVSLRGTCLAAIPHAHRRHRLRGHHRLLEMPESIAERRGSPRLLGRLCVRAEVEHRAGRVAPHPSGRNAAAFETPKPLGIRNYVNFAAAFLRPARLPAYAPTPSLPPAL